jgi:hypothetical protein
MGLLDDLQPPVKIWPCKIRTVAATLDEKDAKILYAAVEGSEWQIKSLSTALRLKGIVISDVPIKAHREKSCSCWKN